MKRHAVISTKSSLGNVTTKLITSILLLGLLSLSQVLSAESNSSTASTDDNYASCIACHGVNGQGNQQLNAPGLANLESAYIQRQLANFRDGVRGAHPLDTTGAQMRAFVSGFSDTDIQALADSIADFSDYKPVPTLTGDPQQGKDYYYHQCGACHGFAAKGNPAMKAPKLAGLEDWYTAAQLEKFRKGVRGTHEQDKLGAQMHFIMQRFPDSQQITDIISYLRGPVDAE